MPTAPPAWPAEEARRSSSEDDTDADVEAEGLRRRRGREPSTPRPVEGQARGEGAGGEPGFSPNMCLLGALVLLGLGILLFCGERYLPAAACSLSARPLLPLSSTLASPSPSVSILRRPLGV